MNTIRTRIVELVTKAGFPLLLIVFVAVVPLWIMGVSQIMATIGSIADPTERGLAYVAAAIVLHTLFRGNGLWPDTGTNQPKMQKPF